MNKDNPSAFSSVWAACTDKLTQYARGCPNDLGHDAEMGPLGCRLDGGIGGCVCRDMVTAIAALTPPADAWRPIETAPKDGTPFLAWCPITHGLGDGDTTPDGEWRVLWWETRGQFTSDRDLGDERFTGWQPLPHPPVIKDSLTAGHPSPPPLHLPPQDRSGQ